MKVSYEINGIALLKNWLVGRGMTLNKITKFKQLDFGACVPFLQHVNLHIADLHVEFCDENLENKKLQNCHLTDS